MNVMEDVDSGPTQAADLRREAEQRLHDKNATPIDAMSEVDALRTAPRTAGPPDRTGNAE